MAAALGALLGLAGAPALVRRMGKKRACLLVFGLAIAAGVTPILLRLAGHGPANGTAELLWMLSGTGVLGTACGLATAVIAASMVADIVEDAELRTGRRAEGLLTSVNAFVAKSVSGLGVLLAGLVISLVDFPQRASPGAVVPEILTRLVLIYVAIVAVSLALSMWCLRWYSLSRESHAATLEALQQRRRARQG
jgi:Na+/melibiose symporter-like transporter